ncbi:MAG: twin-arginine translocase TatA/TatE family subunit [Acidobacteriota bacterium]
MHYSIFLLGFGMQEMLILLLIVLVLFGGSRLPSLAKGLGESVRNFKRGISEEAEEPPPAPKDQTKRA